MQALGRGARGQPDGRDAARHRSAVRHLPADHGRRGGAVAAAEPADRDGGRGGHADRPGRYGEAVARAVAEQEGCNADDWRQAFRCCRDFEPVAYQLKGAKMKRRIGYFDRGADPRSARMAGGETGAINGGGPLRKLVQCSANTALKSLRESLMDFGAVIASPRGEALSLSGRAGPLRKIVQ